MDHVSRRAAPGMLGVGAVLGKGCMTKPVWPANPDGTYGFAVGKWYRRTLTCTPTPIPPESVDAEAKRFRPALDQLTVYVVRKRWGNVINEGRLAVDNGAPVVTTPESFMRLRLQSGPHRFTAAWSEGSTELVVSGAAGEVRVVELVGSVWSSGSTYRLDHGDVIKGRNRAARLRLVADVQ